MNTQYTPLQEKCQFLWDYYKDCFGHRPRHFLPAFWQNEAEVDAAIGRCDDWLQRMKSTPEGLETLREEGWVV